MKKQLLLSCSMSLVLTLCLLTAAEEDIMGIENSDIKAFCIDWNSYRGTFAPAGLWSDVEPEKHVAWHKSIGANVIQTFCVSCNGYAWYKNGVVPEQPGLKHDFLRETVKLGRKENIKVMGYFCIGTNLRWARLNPEHSYGEPAYRPHIPYTDKYLEYLDAAIRDVIRKTDIDGFMVDWLWQPHRPGDVWLDSEKKLYEELMQKPFPKKMMDKEYLVYSRKAIGRCWDTIYRATKETKQDCVIWLTCNKINHPHVVNSKMFQQVDWLMNEEGNIKHLQKIKKMVGPKTRLITCLAPWNRHDPKLLIPEALQAGIGLYGYAKPKSENPILPKLESFAHKPKGRDQQNMAALASAYKKATPKGLTGSNLENRK